MDLTGTILKIFPTKKISDKFQIREFVIKSEEKYPQEIILQLSQDRCVLLDNLTEGEKVQAFVNVRGRSWTNPQGEIKYFNSLEVWKISNESAQSFNSYQDGAGNIEGNFKEDAINSMVPDDDGLPF